MSRNALAAVCVIALGATVLGVIYLGGSFFFSASVADLAIPGITLGSGSINFGTGAAGAAGATGAAADAAGAAGAVLAAFLSIATGATAKHSHSN